MKICFLDIDGVLNSSIYFTARTKQNKNALHDIDPVAAVRMQRLCDETGASLVISSTWRLLHKRLAIADILGARGLTAQILDVTPALPERVRGEEIQAWLDENDRTGRFDITNMVIIDDDSDMAHLKPWLVKTTFFDGFTDHDLRLAVAMLSKPMPQVPR